MEYPDFQRHVLARASTAFHGDKVQARDLDAVLGQFIVFGNELDNIKKALMYGRDYRNQFTSNSDMNCTDALGELTEEQQGIIHAILGFATEGVELVEALHNFMFRERTFDKINLAEEFGDGEWYRALGLYWLGQTNEENLGLIDAKLEKRYGPVEQGFQYRAANERDLEGERQVLEGKAIVDEVQAGEDRKCLKCEQLIGTLHLADCPTFVRLVSSSTNV